MSISNVSRNALIACLLLVVVAVFVKIASNTVYAENHTAKFVVEQSAALLWQRANEKCDGGDCVQHAITKTGGKLEQVIGAIGNYTRKHAVKDSD